MWKDNIYFRCRDLVAEVQGLYEEVDSRTQVSSTFHGSSVWVSRFIEWYCNVIICEYQCCMFCWRQGSCSLFYISNLLHTQSNNNWPMLRHSLTTEWRSRKLQFANWNVCLSVLVTESGISICAGDHFQWWEPLYILDSNVTFDYCFQEDEPSMKASKFESKKKDELKKYTAMKVVK